MFITKTFSLFSFVFRYIQVYSNGELVDDHLSMYLGVANPESLRLGWKRRASFSFLLLNQSGKELYRTKGIFNLADIKCVYVFFTFDLIL